MDVMSVSLMVWVVTCAVILGLFVFDFYAHVRVPHEPTFRESAMWSSVYIGLAVVFGLVVWWLWGGQFAGEYFAGYVTEKALSVDNLFVFTVIMGTFAVPREFQQKLLLIGIEQIRAIVVDDADGVAEQLDSNMAKSVAAYRDPWHDGRNPVTEGQFRTSLPLIPLPQVPVR